MIFDRLCCLKGEIVTLQGIIKRVLVYILLTKLSLVGNASCNTHIYTDMHVHTPIIVDIGTRKLCMID